MRSSRQNDKSEQWVMHWAVKDEVLRSILGSKKQKFWFHLYLYLLYWLSIQVCLIINQFTIKSKTPI